MTDPNSHGRPPETGGPAPAPRAEPSAMMRSEERLAVGVEWAPYRAVRLGKRIVTESRTFTVDVEREELFYEEFEPADGAPAASDLVEGRGFEMVLHEEHVVVTRVVTPVERVRVRVGRIDGAVDISAAVAKERIVVDRAPAATHPSPETTTT